MSDFSTTHFGQSGRRFARQAILLALAACVATFGLMFCAGCQSTADWLDPAARRAYADSKASPSAKSSANSGAKGKSTPAVDPFKSLADDGWIQSVTAPGQTDPPPHRWRHRALDDILDRPREKQPDWLAALHSEKPIVATNAAIALARLGEGHPEEALATGVRVTELKGAARQAAAEALGEVQSAAALAQLRQLLDEYGRFTGEARSHYVPELHSELLRSLAHQSAAANDPRIAEALKSPAPMVKRVALEALTKQQDATVALPPLAIDLTTDGDTQVRIAALRLVVQRKDPQAGDKLQRALSDYELSVRLTAIELLGQTGGDNARARLKQLTTDHAELIRTAAVESLAKQGDRDTVEGAATDRSWRVRKAVAASLGQYPDRRSANLAQQFIGDLSLEVQRETVRMTAAWPLEAAGPVLLSAIESPTYQTRKDAATLLADRWPAAAGFPLDAPPERRAELTAQLQSQWTAQFGNLDQSAIAASIAASKPPEIPLARRREVQRLLDILADPHADDSQQTAAAESLVAIGADLPGILEAIQVEQRPMPTRFYRDVLAHCGKEFELAEQLADPNLTIRRAAVVALAKLSENKTLSVVAMNRISQLLAGENDPIVWISALKLIDHDPRQPAALLAAAGMSHPSAEVRRRACGYFATYPDPARIDLLWAALADDSISVLHAAAEALGEFPPPAETTPLEKLLATNDHSVRLDAAISLARWKAPAGTAALERLAADEDPVIRRKTAQAIGKLEATALMPVLIKMLDDQQDIRRAALISLKSLTGSENPPSENGPRPASFETSADGGKDPAATLLEQAQRWKQWYGRQNR